MLVKCGRFFFTGIAINEPDYENNFDFFIQLNEKKKPLIHVGGDKKVVESKYNFVMRVNGNLQMSHSKVKKKKKNKVTKYIGSLKTNIHPLNLTKI